MQVGCSSLVWQSCSEFADKHLAGFGCPLPAVLKTSSCWIDLRIEFSKHDEAESCFDSLVAGQIIHQVEQLMEP